MPQDFKESCALDAGKFITLRKADGTPEKGLGIDPDDVPSHFRAQRQIKHEFGRKPVPLIGKKDGAGAATGTAADVNIICYPDLALEYFIIGTQTIVFPKMVAGGLDIGQMDQTNGDGLELNSGLLGNGDECFTVGTSPAFFVEWEIKCGTVANLGTTFVGVRKVEANAAVYTSYTEYAGFLLTGGAVHIKTRKASGTAVDTDTTQTLTDATAIKLRVLVDASGVLSYQVNGSNPTVVPTSAVTLTSAVKLMPVIEFIQGASQSTFIILSRTCGFL